MWCRGIMICRMYREVCWADCLSCFQIPNKIAVGVVWQWSRPHGLRHRTRMSCWQVIEDVGRDSIHHCMGSCIGIGMMVDMILFVRTKRCVAMTRYGMTVGVPRHRRWRMVAAFKGEGLLRSIISTVILGMMKLRCCIRIPAVHTRRHMSLSS